MQGNIFIVNYSSLRLLIHIHYQRCKPVVKTSYAIIFANQYNCNLEMSAVSYINLLLVNYKKFTIGFLQQKCNNGDQWRPGETSGDQLRPVETSGDQWRPVETSGDQWRQVETSHVLR